MNKPGSDGMWDEEDGFYYDLLRLPDGSATRLKVRSMVGLLPLCASTVIEKRQRELAPRALAGLQRRLGRIPELMKTIHPIGPGHLGVAERGMLALLNPERLRRILTKMLDENEFLSPYGIRSLSKFHEKYPFIFHVQGQEYRVDYLPAESNTGMFGGNSNWRGPIWMPVNALIIRALLSFYLYYGDNFKIECPTGSGRMMNLFEVAREIADRLTRIFLRDERNQRPVYGGTEKFQSDPHWRDHILFYEYFHGDNGAGLGASHQTGWTGLVAKLIQLFGLLDPQKALEVGKSSAFVRGKSEGEEVEVKIETLEAQLKEWGIDLEKFRAKADKAKTKAKVKLDNEVVILRSKMDEAQKKLEELKRTGDAASGELKKGIENAWAEVKKAFDSATTKFK